jgi:DNA-binding beta-propeller fold protein YncE
MAYWRPLLGLVVGSVFVGLLLRHFAATNPVLATVVVGPLPRSVLADDATGRVFVSTVAQLGSVVVLDGASGAKLRTVPLGVSQSESGVAAPFLSLAGTDRGPIWASLQDGAAFALDPARGDVVQRLPAHRVSSPWPVGGHPARGLVWDTANNLLVEDMASRKPVARLPLGQLAASYEATQQTQRLFLLSAAGEVSTVDAYRGVVLHTVQTSAGYYPWIGVSAATRHLFVFAGTDTLLMLDIRSGRVVGTIHAAVGTPPSADTPPFWLAFEVSPRGDQLWVTNPASRTLSVFATATGALLFSARVGPTPMAVAADPRHHHLLVLCRGESDLAGDPLDYGSLCVVDSLSGKVERTVPVGAAPGGLAIDGRTSRAFVLNADVGADMLRLHLPQRHDAAAALLAALHRWLPFAPAAPAATDEGSVAVLDTSRL